MWAPTSAERLREQAFERSKESWKADILSRVDEIELALRFAQSPPGGSLPSDFAQQLETKLLELSQRLQTVLDRDWYNSQMSRINEIVRKAMVVVHSMTGGEHSLQVAVSDAKPLPTGSPVAKAAAALLLVIGGKNPTAAQRGQLRYFLSRLQKQSLSPSDLKVYQAVQEVLRRETKPKTLVEEAVDGGVDDTGVIICDEGFIWSESLGTCVLPGDVTFYQRHKKAIWVGGGLAVLGVGAYFIWGR
jgi:hypothetical protein